MSEHLKARKCVCVCVCVCVCFGGVVSDHTLHKSCFGLNIIITVDLHDNPVIFAIKETRKRENIEFLTRPENGGNSVVKRQQEYNMFKNTVQQRC